MPTFGQHETAQRLFLSGVGGLFLLKADSRKAVKVLQPAPGIWSDDQLQEEIDAFLVRAKTQRLLASNSRHWAPVHEVALLHESVESPELPDTSVTPLAGAPAPAAPGPATKPALEPRASSVASAVATAEPPIGAFAVIDRYERSAQSLIDGRVAITNDDLRNLISGVLLGLIDIRKTGRPHGALRPSNILLSNSADLAQAAVYLADPAPDGALNKNSPRKDLSDLAKIIYELITLRPYSGGTIGRSREWTRLGPNGEDWRKLCITLLDTGAPSEALDLEKIHATIQTWLAKPPKDKKPLMIAASILLVLGLGSFSLWYFTRPPKLAFDQTEWETLCIQYQAWFGDFSDHLSDDGVKRKFAAAPYPTEVIKVLADNAEFLDKSDPKKIARKPSSFDQLAVSPTDDAKTGYGPYYTKKGVELINGVSIALSPQHWSLLQSLEKSAKTFDDRGWKKPAAGIRTLIASARPPAMPPPGPDIAARVKAVHPADLAGNIEKTLQASRTVADISTRWDRIQELLKGLPATGIPLVNALPKFAQDFPRSEAPTGEGAPPATLAEVTALDSSFAQIEDLVNKVVASLAPPGREVVFAELARDPAAALPPPPNDQPTPEQFRALIAVSKDYLKLTADPRATVDWTRSLDDVQKEFIDKIAEANPEDANLPVLKQRHAALAAEINAFAPARLPPIEKNRARIVAMVSQAKDDLAKLNRDGGEWVSPYIIDPAAYIAQQKARITTSPLARATPVVYAEWKKHHTALLTKIEAAPAELKKYRTFKAVDAKFTSLENTYKEFDTARIPASVPALSQIAGTDWRHAIAAHVASAYRDKALLDIMTAPALKWADDLPQVDDPGYLSFQKQRLADFEKTRIDTLALIADYTTITDRLNHLQLEPDPPARGTPAWRALFDKWQRHALLADAAISDALSPISTRVKALVAIDAITDYKPLLENVSSTAPEIALTAWRKLGNAPLGENLAVLDDEDAAEAALTATLNKVQQTITPPQLTALTAEIAAQRPVRWRRYAETLQSPQAIQSALDRADAFKVTLTPQTDPAMSYNRLLYALRKEFDKNPKEAELKATTQSFINSVNALPPAIAKNKPIEELLARLAKPLQATEVESSSAGAGPKLAGWEQENPTPDLRLFYFPSKAAPRYTLAFAKVQVTESSAGGAQKSIFLCTTEMPIGLFTDTVNTSGKFADLDNTGKPSPQQHWFKAPARAADDVWLDLGVRGWKIIDKKFSLNGSWLFEDIPQMGLGAQKKPYYPDNARALPPSPNDPIQLLSPWSAMYVARLLGCRLPTTDEWQAAYAKFEQPAGPGTQPRDAWNLRGDGPPGRATWSAQQDHAQKFANLGMKFPDQGIFLNPDLLFAGITAQAAKPWKAADLAKLAPARITPAPDIYKGNTLWFRPVGAQPGAAPATAGGMHDLVGNVAEYAFDGPGAINVIKDNLPTTAAIDAAVTAGKRSVFVLGGSSLSPPDVLFNQKQELDITFPPTAIGFCDVGFRLAYTAPIDSIFDVLAATFKEPAYLPGPKARQPG